VPLQGEPVAQPILQGNFNRGSAEVSPDGRWLVYRSDQSGQDEVYVQPYPGPGPTVPVSIGGGTHVTWSPDGTELTYRLDERMMAVSFTVEGDTPRIGPPTELFRGDYYNSGPAQARQYHIAPDGRFLMLKEVSNETRRRRRVATTGHPRPELLRGVEAAIKRFLSRRRSSPGPARAGFGRRIRTVRVTKAGSGVIRRTAF
jgi:hypothetical protein